MGTSSFYAALAGLSANRQAIDVIGNNLANLNTIGFKKSFVTFADVLGSSLSNAVNGAGNPMEVGLGSRVASIDQIFSQGSLRSSGTATDMAIQGAGFFMLQGDDGIVYSRAGKFSFNSSGDLVAPNGKTVLGYPADINGDILTSETPQAININANITSSPNTTTELGFTSLLDADAVADSPVGEFSTPVTVYDSLGVPHTLNFVFRRLDPPGLDSTGAQAAVQWAFDIRMDSLEVEVAGGGAVAGAAEGVDFSLLTGAIVPDGASVAGGDFATGRLSFDANGVLQDVNFAGSLQAGGGAFTIATPDVDPNGLTIPAGFELASGADPIDFAWDVFNLDGSTNVVSYAADSGSSTSSVTQNGYGVGVLNSVIVDTDGTLTGLFSNGDIRDLAQVTLANFNNPQGLLSIGDNEYRATPGSGQASVGTPESGGRGTVSGNTLELSNVDLAEEFTNLIITERGYQANSKVITTNDQLLQEAIALSRG